MAPQVGLEPTTLRLTAGCSAIELLRSVVVRDSHFHNSIDAAGRESGGLLLENARGRHSSRHRNLVDVPSAQAGVLRI
jgi:hypothetical protein